LLLDLIDNGEFDVECHCKESLRELNILK